MPRPYEPFHNLNNTINNSAILYIEIYTNNTRHNYIYILFIIFIAILEINDNVYGYVKQRAQQGL